MPFPTRGAAAPAPSAPAAPAPPSAPTPPPSAPSNLKLWVFVNGQTVLKTDAEARALPPTTPAMSEDQTSGWSTVVALLPAAPAYTGAPAAPPAPAAPGGRAAFGRPAAAAPAPAPAAVGRPPALFSGVEGANVYRKGSLMTAGDYIAKLCASEFKAGRNGNFVINEVEIITSSYSDADPATHECNREGSRVSIFLKQNDNFASNIKEVMLAVSGFDEAGKARPEDDVVTQAECDALISPEQPYAGALVYLEARAIKTKVGGDFTRISWWPCPQKADGTPDLDKLMREVR